VPHDDRVLFIACRQRINLLNINELYQQIVLGIILLLAVSIDVLARKAPTLLIARYLEE